MIMSRQQEGDERESDLWSSAEEYDFGSNIEFGSVSASFIHVGGEIDGIHADVELLATDCENFPPKPTAVWKVLIKPHGPSCSNKHEWAHEVIARIFFPLVLSINELNGSKPIRAQTSCIEANEIDSGEVWAIVEFDKQCTYDEFFEIRAQYDALAQAVAIEEMESFTEALLGDGVPEGFEPVVHFEKAEKEVLKRVAERGGTIEHPDPIERKTLQKLFRSAPDMIPPGVGRNDLCPCGSGKKFKKCCGAPNAALEGDPIE